MKLQNLLRLLAAAFVGWFAPSSNALKFDFSDAKQLASWDVLRDVGGKWELSDGALKFTAPGARWDMFALKDIEFTDGTISFRLKWLSGTYCEAGVAYRIQDKPDTWPNYQIHLSTVEPALRWGYNIAQIDGGQWGPELPRPPVKEWTKLPQDKWFHFKIEVKGDTHTVSGGPDGKLDQLAQVKENTLKAGRIGFIGYSGMAEETLLDDFEVTGPGIPSLSVSPKGKLATTWADMKG